jgi:Rrf2 family transcriptional regulator, iron-sulfur cluster assembly transcription factor
MIRFSARARYGVRAVAALAAANSTRPLSVGAIGGEESIPAEYLEQLFCKLRRSGIVSSVRGPGGGFALAQGSRDITLKQILDAVGEPILPEEEPGCDSAEGSVQASSAVWYRLSRLVNEFLSTLTIADILEDARDVPPGEPPSGPACTFGRNPKNGD